MPELRSFLIWLQERGPVPESELAEVVAQDPRRALGFRVARDLGILAYPDGPEGRRVAIR